ncbi:MAG: HigA family addiction module antidote protein [Butyrivibrio sp.]|nr:HigA family addiction module antidote protein [Butyrivibrio sp.]
MIKKIELPTVGEILKEEFMEPYGISAYRLAKDIFVSVSRIQAIISGTRKITVDTSIRLGKYFGLSYDYFINIQNDLDIRNTSESMIEEFSKIKEVMYN